VRSTSIIDVVVKLLMAKGYDAVQVRTVARRARISLRTLYQRFGTLDELILAALERWMEANAYAGLTMPKPDESAHETMVRVLRTVFAPWERHPRMLEAYHRARSGPGGERLVLQGMIIVKPIIEAALPDVDPAWLADVEMIHSHVTRAAIARFADGEIEVTEILPILEQTLLRLTMDNRSGPARSRLRLTAGGAKSRRAPSRRRRQGVAVGRR
jgi:TetR/AcrR family transcriptional regulator, cholesterol catabolism regulator